MVVCGITLALSWTALLVMVFSNVAAVVTWLLTSSRGQQPYRAFRLVVFTTGAVILVITIIRQVLGLPMLSF